MISGRRFIVSPLSYYICLSEIKVNAIGLTINVSPLSKAQYASWFSLILHGTYKCGYLYTSLFAYIILVHKLKTGLPGQRIWIPIKNFYWRLFLNKFYRPTYLPLYWVHIGHN